MFVYSLRVDGGTTWNIDTRVRIFITAELARLHDRRDALSADAVCFPSDDSIDGGATTGYRSVNTSRRRKRKEERRNR